MPDTAATLVEEWDLTLDGPPREGARGVLLPVRTSAGRPAMLKVAFPDDESEHEALALQHWGGRGAVRLLRADPHRRALLVERLHTEDLRDLWDLEACEIVAALYADLHRPAVPQLRTLSSYVATRLAALGELPRGAPVPRRLVEQALAIGRDLVTDPATDGTLVHGDLHYGNVLAADRLPWLAINPRPLSGDPHYELAPMLWNRFDELAGDVRGGVRRRFHTLVDAADLDEDRARAWVVLRQVTNAAERLDDRAWLTTSIAVAKAVQD